MISHISLLPSIHSSYQEHFQQHHDEYYEKSHDTGQNQIMFHSYGYNEEIRNFRNRVNGGQLDKMLNLLKKSSNDRDIFMKYVEESDIDIDYCIVKFSERFSAMWIYHGDDIFWFCEIDGQFVQFVIKPKSEIKQVEILTSEEDGIIPEILMPSRDKDNDLTWTMLQQMLVDNFEDDESVRAISAAVILSCTPVGEYTSVPVQLFSKELKTLSRTKINFNSPLDDDIVTVLADPYESDGCLIFVSGGGYVAQSSFVGSMAVLERIEMPKNVSMFVETADLLMPFLFM